MNTFQHQLQQFDPGIVWLDNTNCVVGFNSVAKKIFGANANKLIGQGILQLHPESSRPKVKWLLESSSCPVESSIPMTMMINIPDRVLLVKVSKMFGEDSDIGTCMIFFDLTDIATIPIQEDGSAKQLRKFLKLPVYENNKVLLVDLDMIAHIKADGHYTSVYAKNKKYFCNLAFSDLEGRLNTREFVRIHRSHIININFAKYFEKVDGQCTVIMDTADKKSLPISRSKVNMLQTLLGLT